VIDAQQIANLGIPGLNVVAVDKKVIDAHPEVVQQYVCAQVAATRAFTGPQADKYLVTGVLPQGPPTGCRACARSQPSLGDSRCRHSSTRTATSFA
jgi:hypothetical protein